MLDFKEQNDKDREFFEQDFSVMDELLKRIRKALVTGESVSLKDLSFDGILNFNKEMMTYITLFQAGKQLIRYGSRKVDLETTINRDIEMIRKNRRFNEFSPEDENLCRIMFEYIIERNKIAPSKLNSTDFNEGRFETGVTGLELRKDGISYYYMPTDAVVLSQMTLNAALRTLVKKTPIGKMTNRISERLKILSQSKDYEYYLFKTRAFISYKNKFVPLYRGNIRYTEFSYDVLFNQVIKSAEWLYNNMYDDGRFLYYYDCCEDTYKDHEHPNRPIDNLYYNDLRHCGGVIALLRAYQLTADVKYLEAAKKGLNWSVSVSRDHQTDWGTGYYAFYNNKSKLGGTGVLLVAMMQYRNITGDKSFDEYIKGYARHIMSRIYSNGELLGYYIHPAFQDGQPLINMTDDERKATFSFYYPGEALFGLGLFVNNFEDDAELVSEARRMGEKALDWIIEERPRIYADQFTALPSDAWLMQAVEEWAKDEHFRKDNYINFVFKDANTMVEKTYTRDDSPFIDYEGGYYYEYGDHYYPDGARSEGLVASYYLARFLGRDELAQKLKKACQNVAMCQFHLYNDEINNYSHRNPDRSCNSIRFKATRQWVRVDSIQHVSCFFARLFMADNEYPVKH